MTADKKSVGKEKNNNDEKRPSTVAARSAAADEGRKQKEIYQKWKAFAIKREKENYSKLFIVHEKKNWWKMVGHSAIIFNYEVSKWINYNCKLRTDSDFENKSEEGVINIKNIYELDKRLAAFNISLLKSTDDYRIYNIGKKFTEGDIERMKKEKELEWAKVNKLILPKEIFPTLYLLERDLFVKVFYMSQKMDKYTKERITDPIVNRTADLLRDYSLLANDKGLTETGYLERVKEEMQWCISQMVLVSELRALPPEKIFQILSLMGKVQREIEICRPKKVPKDDRFTK